jgi:hypothetical protein
MTASAKALALSEPALSSVVYASGKKGSGIVDCTGSCWYVGNGEGIGAQVAALPPSSWGRGMAIALSASNTLHRNEAVDRIVT